MAVLRSKAEAAVRRQRLWGPATNLVDDAKVHAGNSCIGENTGFHTNAPRGVQTNPRLDKGGCFEEQRCES
jgi:hypothetical protein